MHRVYVCIYFRQNSGISHIHGHCVATETFPPVVQSEPVTGTKKEKGSMNNRQFIILAIF